MRSLDASLLTAQKDPVNNLVKIQLTQGANDDTYLITGTGFIYSMQHSEQRYSQKATVILDNSEGTFDAKTYGEDMYKGVISWGLVDATGTDKYSAAAPLYVVGQQFHSSPGHLLCILDLIGLFDLMGQDRASAEYVLEADDSQTVKTLLTSVIDGTIAPFSHTVGFTATYDSEDSLIDSMVPADAFRISLNDTRLDVVKRLLVLTKCVGRIEADGAVHIFVPAVDGPTWTVDTKQEVNDYVQPTSPNNNFRYRCSAVAGDQKTHATTEPTWPTTAGNTVVDDQVTWIAVAPDFEYTLDAGDHAFYKKARRERVVMPNFQKVDSHPASDDSYTGSAEHKPSSDLTPPSPYTSAEVREHKYMRLTSNEEAANVAAARLEADRLDAEKGSASVLVHCGAETMDYTKLKDSRHVTEDIVIGNIGYLTRHYRPNVWDMRFGFGDPRQGGFLGLDLPGDVEITEALAATDREAGQRLTLDWLLNRINGIRDGFIQTNNNQQLWLEMLQNDIDALLARDAITSNPWLRPVDWQQVRIVAGNLGYFGLIQDAIDDITDAASGKRYLVLVMPGEYAETIAMKAYVDVVGVSKHACRITGVGADTVASADNCLMANLTIAPANHSNNPLSTTSGHNGFNMVDVDILEANVSIASGRFERVYINGAAALTSDVLKIITNSEANKALFYDCVFEAGGITGLIDIVDLASGAWAEMHGCKIKAYIDETEILIGLDSNVSNKRQLICTNLSIDLIHAHTDAGYNSRLIGFTGSGTFFNCSFFVHRAGGQPETPNVLSAIDSGGVDFIGCDFGEFGVSAVIDINGDSKIIGCSFQTALKWSIKATVQFDGGDINIDSLNAAGSETLQVRNCRLQGSFTYTAGTWTIRVDGNSYFPDINMLTQNANITYQFSDLQTHLFPSSELTIASGAITVTRNFHTVETEGAAATDDLDTINGLTAGEEFVLKAANTGRTVVIKHNTGNIQTMAEADIFLDTTEKAVKCLYDGTNVIVFSEIVVGTHQAVTSAPTGFPNRSDSSISFVVGTRTFTIAPTGTSFDYYIAGARYTVSTSEDLIIAPTSGIHAIHYDGATLSETVNPSESQFDDLIVSKALVALVYWNATNGAVYILGDERHGAIMSGETHHWLHDNMGARWKTGLNASGYTLSTKSDAALKFDVSNGELYDEDIDHEIENGVASNQYEQVLQGDAEIPVLYRDGDPGHWKEQAASTLPYKNAGDNQNLAYNSLAGSTWGQTPCGNTKFVVYTLIASNDWQYPIKMVQGNAQYDSKSAALEGAQTEMTAWGTMPSPEFVILFRFIMQTGVYAGVKNAQIIEVTDFRAAEITGASAVEQDHGTLSGLSHDDHAQYILHSLATAANDFLVASGSGTYVKKTLAETLAILTHTVASHSDTSATGSELNTLTNNSMADTLHRHSELSASDGSPDAVLSLNSGGNALFLKVDPVFTLQNANATGFEYFEFGKTVASSFVRSGYVGEGSSGNENIYLAADIADVILIAAGDIILSPTGNVGIGVTDPDTKLEVFNAGNQLKLSFDGTDNAIFAVDTNGVLTITPSGAAVDFASKALINVLDLDLGTASAAGTLWAMLTAANAGTALLIKSRDSIDIHRARLGLSGG
ncbi:hypothetical protein LCGC14_0808570, partial [marine sediment metagenome]